MSLHSLVMLQCISIMLLSVECVYIFYRWRTKMHAYLFLYCIATLVNNIGYLMEMTAGDSGEALMGTQVCYLGKVFIPISFVLFVLKYCGVRVPKWLAISLAAFHAGVFVLVLTCEYQNLFYSDINYTTLGLFPHNVYGHGIVYWIYIGMIVLYFVIAFCVLIRSIIRTRSKENRTQLCFLLASSFVAIAGLALFMSGITEGYDATAISYMICTLFMYISLFRYNLLDTLELVKNYAIDNLSESIIAINDYDGVIYYNAPALQLYPSLSDKKNGVVSELNDIVVQKEMIHKGDKIFSPEIRSLYQNHIYRGHLYVISDVTESYNYTQELQKQRDLAEQANASKSAFLSVVSHEIRTPMNAVVGMTDLLLRDELTEKQRKYMMNIKNSGSALVMIVNDLLDQSKIEAGKMEIVEDAYEVKPLLDDVRMIIENRIGSKPIDVRMNLDDQIPDMLVGDSLRIRQILINLMNNAVKFTEEGYIQLSIIVEAKEEEQMLLRFSVKDTGQGIRPEDLNRLFQAFSQVDTKKNHSKEGTGLGLSISRNFIALMGGQLEVASEYGKGSEFFFTIYQKRCEEVSDGSLQIPQRQPWREEDFTAPDARVLLVDDNELNLMIAEEILEPVGMKIDTADSGAKAIQLIRENHYHAVFMDYMMPYMDGAEATACVRKMTKEAEESGNDVLAAYYQSVPIIALTGDTSDVTKEKFKTAGINDFTEKPVDLPRLKKLLTKWLPEDLIQYQTKEGA